MNTSLMAFFALSIKAASRDSKELLEICGFGRFFNGIENAKAERFVAAAMLESTAAELDEGRDDTKELAPAGHAPTGQFAGKTGAAHDEEDALAFNLEFETARLDQPSMNVCVCSQKGTRRPRESPGLTRLNLA